MEEIDATEVLERDVGVSAGPSLISCVSENEQTRDSRCRLELERPLLDTLAYVSEDHGLGAVACESLGDRQPDAPAGAGYDAYFSFKPAHQVSPAGAGRRLLVRRRTRPSHRLRRPRPVRAKSMQGSQLRLISAKRASRRQAAL